MVWGVGACIVMTLHLIIFGLWEKKIIPYSSVSPHGRALHGPHVA